MKKSSENQALHQKFHQITKSIGSLLCKMPTTIFEIDNEVQTNGPKVSVTVIPIVACVLPKGFEKR